MCGVACIASPDPADHLRLEAMTDLLWHRGPESCGYLQGPPVSLGHRRLAILDLSPAGAQPLKNESGDIFLICNGEMYNYAEKNAYLRSKGHRIVSGSDSETMLHLYEEYGDSFLEHVNGMFACIVWDQRERRLLAAVDRFGKKPLYYAQLGDKLILASELKSLLLFPWVSRETDPLAIDRYLCLRHVPAPLSMFKSVKKLPPATLLSWRDGQLSLARYWKPRRGDNITYGPRALDEFEELFSDAVRIRLFSDVPLGLYLSGGVDSSAVAAMMRKLDPANERQAFTLSVPYKHDESEKARRIAEHLGIGFNVLEVENDDFSLLPAISYHLDEPFGDLLCLPSYLLAKKAKQKLTVCLTGDGADEICFGYFHQKVMALRERFLPFFKLPFAGKLMSLGAFATPLGVLNRLFDYPDRIKERELLKLCQMLGHAGSFSGFYFGLTSCFSAEDKGLLYSDSMRAAVREHPLEAELEEDFAAAPEFSFFSRLSLLDLKYWLPYSLLYRLDKMNMAHAVETRSPFLDYRVVEFFLNLEDAGKLGGGRNKALLRDLTARLLPPALQEPGKQAFYMPLTKGHREVFRNWASGLLRREAVAAQGYFDYNYIDGLFESFPEGSMLVNRQLTALAMLGQWFKSVDGASCPV